MKKQTFLFYISFLLFLVVISDRNTEKPLSREAYQDYINQHPYNKRKYLSPQELKAIPKTDRPDLAWEQDFLATMDPKTKRPERKRLVPIFKKTQQQRAMAMRNPGAVNTPWVERGPNNVGGRTRALMYDPNDPSGNKVWAGGITGGLWYNNDITDANSSWISVGDFWDNIAITCIAYDPTNTNIFYVGTGEGWDVRASRGAGIWKTTDGGITWSQLSTTTDFYYVNDLVVRNESGVGVVYASVDNNAYYEGINHNNTHTGILQSNDGGTNWTRVTLPNTPEIGNAFEASDIEIAADNTLWIAGEEYILKSTDGSSWTVFHPHDSNNPKRLEIACAPSNSNVVYGIVTNLYRELKAIVKTTDGGGTWTTLANPVDADVDIPDDDFTRGQAWYNLSLAVDPNDPNVVIAGGIDLFRSTDGGMSWSQISKWSNNNNLYDLTCSLVHADQHAIIFKPGFSSEVIFGNDGGVFYSNSISTAATNDVIAARNKNYNVTQFYATAIHPHSGTDYFLAGSQDNGTQRFTSSGINTTTRVTGGDGAFCHIDQLEPNYQFTSYVYNWIYRSTDGGNSFGWISSDLNSGLFINPSDYDSYQQIMYSAYDTSALLRLSNLHLYNPIQETISIPNMGSIASHIRVSPHTKTSSTLFVGTRAGKLFKVTHADSDTSTATEITGVDFPNGNIACVEIGATENELLVIFSNYGVTSIWYSNDGGSSWVSKEGNLPDMPIRWALFNPNNRNEVILATEVGVWATENFDESNPTWTASNSGLANVRVDMLQLRASDTEVIAATHGRGLFSSNGFAENIPPIADFYIEKTTNIVPTETITLYDQSTANPTSHTWSISPNTFTYANGTHANSINPEVAFNTEGTYTISLTVSNAFGSDTKTSTIDVINAINSYPYIQNFDSFTNPLTISSDGWENMSSDYMEWLVNANSTPTPSTGPSGDHTSGTGNYLYIEGDNVVNGFADAFLFSPYFDLSTLNKPELSFWYYMYGADIDDLYMAIYEVATDTWYYGADLFLEQQTSSTDPWRKATIDLSSFSGIVRISFTAYAWSNIGDIAIDDVEVKESEAINVFPYTEDFTTFNGWTHLLTGADISWTKESRTYNGSHTGPISDHTGSGYYLGVLASEKPENYPNKSAHLISPHIDISSLATAELRFWYHMYGADMGELHVDIFDVATNTWTNDVMTPLIGQQQSSYDDSWLEAVVNLLPYSGEIRVRFRGITGAGFASDIAIDDVQIVGSCLLSLELGPDITINQGTDTTLDAGAGFSSYLWSTGETTQTITINTGDTYSVTTTDANGCIQSDTLTVTGKIVTYPYIQNFDSFTNPFILNDGWENMTSDDMEWSVNANATPTANTGPSEDHTSGNGNYLYMEADNAAFYYSEAFLFSPYFDLSGLSNPELSFWYHMHGAKVEELYIDVYEPETATWTPLYLIYSEQQTASTAPWKKMTINLSKFSETIRIAFTAYSGSNNLSDIAIDDIRVGEARKITAFPYTEPFDSYNGWTYLVEGNDFNWSERTGSTPSSNTGPSGDHTTGLGGYLYTEASSGNNPNKVAHIISPYIDLSTLTTAELSFWHHMYGVDMGELHIDIFDVGTNTWTNDVMTPITGQQQSASSDPWLEATIDLTAFSGKEIQIRFRGITGSSFNSDIAIDDVQITGTCDLSLSLGNDITICQGENATLDAGTGYSGYLWSTGETSQTISVNTADTYTVTVTNSSGCSQSDTINISLFTPPVVNLGGDITTCQGEAAILNAGTGFSEYLWSTGETSQSISVNTEGTYTVTVTDANGCTATDTINLTVADIGNNALEELCGTITGTLEIIASNEIHTGDLCASENTTTIESGADILLKAGNKVRLRPGFKVLKGAHFKAEATAVCENNNPITAINNEDILYRNSILIYPNPFSKETTIRYTVAEESHVEILVYNVMGQLVTKLISNSQHPIGAHHVKFNAMHLPAAMYLCKIQIGNWTSLQKIVLED